MLAGTRMKFFQRNFSKSDLKRRFFTTSSEGQKKSQRRRKEEPEDDEPERRLSGKNLKKPQQSHTGQQVPSLPGSQTA